jgi:regulator of sigma E protease
MAGKSAQVGWQSYLGFLALISISLGILNLLPFPMLDGGQLLYDVWELITGKRLPESWQNVLQRIGVAGLMLLTVLALFNDISRLFLR